MDEATDDEGARLARDRDRADAEQAEAECMYAF